jgi:hypothetical protein
MSAVVVRDAPGELAWRMLPSKLCAVAAVTKRLVPYLIEATVIPMLLFYGFLIMLDLTWAFVAALGWSYTAVARRIAGRRPVPALLLFACLGITPAYVDLSVQRERLRVFRAADPAHAGHRGHVRRVRADRSPAHRPFRHRLLPAQP